MGLPHVSWAGTVRTLLPGREQLAIQSPLSRFLWHQQLISSSALQRTGFHPKHFRKSAGNNPANPLTPLSWQGYAPASKHTTSAAGLNKIKVCSFLVTLWRRRHPALSSCCSQGQFFPPSVSLHPIPVSLSVPVSPLTFWLATTGTPVIHTEITVLSHTRHQRAKKSMLQCTVVLLPG